MACVWKNQVSFSPSFQVFVVPFFSSMPSPPSPTEQQLWDACASGHLDLVQHLLATDPSINVNCVGPEKDDTPLHRACRFGHVQVAEFLLKHPAVNVNQGNVGLASPFFIACQEGRHEVVSMLLKDPRIEVNKPQNQEGSPFFFACQNGHKEVVSLLLADMRINVNQLNDKRCTPLWIASHNGHLPAVQRILASERDVDTKAKSLTGGASWTNMTAAEAGHFQTRRARYQGESDKEYDTSTQNGPLNAALIDSFDRDPVVTRQQLRELPELRDFFISDLFALVIFLCEDLLVFRGEATTPSSLSTIPHKAVRFFQIVQCLPMELQMVLCNHVFGAGKDHVLTKHSEPAFKKLVKLSPFLSPADSFCASCEYSFFRLVPLPDEGTPEGSRLELDTKSKMVPERPNFP